ncbi:MAG: DNA replication/repair protein RecF [Acutalibacteraceae bacterium]|nr:DNA replication/repair protein RecF [Acutalibacteraceae bacterium]
MLIKSVSGVSFRNLLPFSFEPHEKMNIICGENAQGKTNIIEAIWLFTGAKSFRTNKDNELVKIGEEKSQLNISFIGENIEKEASIKIGQRRKAVLNEKKLNSASLLAGSFCAVIFSPDDLNLVSGSPEKRRRFLDIAISQIYPKYLETLKRYSRALAQRNYLLKKIKEENISEELLYPFEEELSITGKTIIKYRKRYLELAEEFIKEIYNGISDFKEEFSVIYSPVASEEELLNKIISNRKEDILSGFTTIGPHRDDIDFIINGLSVKAFGSQGQKRSVALSLKLSEAEVLYKTTGEYPVALLDDVMSELDPKRQEFILNHIRKMQVFITCCDPSNFKNLNDGKVFKVEKGCIYT